MDQSSTQQLLLDLKNPKEKIRQQAIEKLWLLWFNQKGEAGWKLLERAQIALEARKFSQAETILTKTIEEQPDFIEAWNRRAVLYYVINEYEKSLEDCLQVVKLNPYHFGAWHGLGLCYATLGNYRAAIQAFEKVMEIQPYALINQKLILECTMKL